MFTANDLTFDPFALEPMCGVFTDGPQGADEAVNFAEELLVVTRIFNQSIAGGLAELSFQKARCFMIGATHFGGGCSLGEFVRTSWFIRSCNGRDGLGRCRWVRIGC